MPAVAEQDPILAELDERQSLINLLLTAHMQLQMVAPAHRPPGTRELLEKIDLLMARRVERLAACSRARRQGAA